jgi:hypothetical protein
VVSFTAKRPWQQCIGDWLRQGDGLDECVEKKPRPHLKSKVSSPVVHPKPNHCTWTTVKNKRIFKKCKQVESQDQVNRPTEPNSVPFILSPSTTAVTILSGGCQYFAQKNCSAQGNEKRYTPYYVSE